MKTLCVSLIGLVASVVCVPLAAAGERAFPSWDNQIKQPARFKVLREFAGAAVLDRKTGLVWEQSPGTAPQPWLVAQISCNTRTVGGRKGWRLPTIQELASLVDPTQSRPALPRGHPFGNVQSSGYWSAPSLAELLGPAFTEPVSNAVVDWSDGSLSIGANTNANHVWCVRGGQGVDPQ